MSRAIVSHVHKRVCQVGSTIIKVEVAMFWYKQLLMGSKESSLPGLIASLGDVSIELMQGAGLFQ